MIVIPKRSRLSDDVAEQVRRLIEESAIHPGDRLPPERELAKQLGVGRTSIREGLRTLAMLGLIEIVPGKGVFLKEGVTAPLDHLIKSWLVTHKGTLRDLIELREAIESQAAQLAAQRASATEIAAMERFIVTMRAAAAANDPEPFVEADTAFHDAIALASGNRLLRRTLASIASEIVTFQMATARLGRPMLERSVADHEAIWMAIKAQAPSAARSAMREHIVRTPMEFKVLEVEAIQAVRDEGGAG